MRDCARSGPCISGEVRPRQFGYLSSVLQATDLHQSARVDADCERPVLHRSACAARSPVRSAGGAAREGEAGPF
eukprot:1990247-Alexandrium_andersonii.AAC.1